LINTENAVFLNDGRYFVAGSAGVHQIKCEADTRPGCQLDSARGLTLCTVLPPEFRGDVCLYSGLTTDGGQLYAACTATDGSALSAVAPKKAALIRIRPKPDAYEIAVTYFEQPTWYNGMAMIDGKTLLMSRSVAGTSVPSSPLPRGPPSIESRSPIQTRSHCASARGLRPRLPAAERAPGRE
jgi:hypothetical protein